MRVLPPRAARRRRPLVLVAAIALVAGVGCGGDGDEGGATTTTAATTEDTGLSSTSLVSTTVPDAAPATDGGVAPDAGDDSGGGGASGSRPPATAAGSADIPLPSFSSFVAIADPCPPEMAPDVSVSLPPYQGKVTVSWTIEGRYDSIYSAIDNQDGPYETELPASGTRTFARQCGVAHTYFVVAVSGGRKVFESESIPAR